MTLRLLFILAALCGVSLFSTEERSNCVGFAIGRLLTEGGFIVLSPSQHGRWLHAEWTSDFKTFEAFVPLEPKRRRRFPPLLFRGRVEER